MKKLQSALSLILLLTTFMLSCKKDKTTKPEQAYRVKEIQNGAEHKTFLYDNANRVVRINFNGGSYRFTYSSTDITAQVYFSNDNPDPSWKYIFDMANGRITGGRRYMPNGAIGREYTYEYDNQQRLTAIVMSLKDFTGDEDENHRYQFLYDGQSDFQQVIFTRKIKTANVLENADSTSVSLTWFTGKSFVTWKDMGFGFFGKATAAIEIQGLETIPFSFTFLEKIIPADRAAQSIETKKYKWNPADGSWSPASTNTHTFPETDYQYNEAGQLQKYKTNTIQWEIY